MVCWRSRSAGCAHPSERMGWLSLVTASPHLIWNTCPDTDEGAGLADAPQRTHSMATYIHHQGVCICRHMMYTQEGQDTPGTAWSGMDRMMYVYTSLERCMHR